MNNLEIHLKDIEKQEQELQFIKFDNSMALELGLMLIDKGKNLNKPISIDITRHGHQLFHYSFEGSSPDNDEWVKRKNNVVNRFYRSSLYVGLKLKLANKSIEEKYLVSLMEYAPYGGAFPIIIKNVGVIGTITVSGLSQEEDHNLVVETIKEYIML
jgi:uncharacterized protein (UPF0303 family)